MSTSVSGGHRCAYCGTWVSGTEVHWCEKMHPNWSPAALDRLAARIEELEGEKASDSNGPMILANALARAEAENERLREALRWIRNRTGGNTGHIRRKAEDALREAPE